MQRTASETKPNPGTMLEKGFRLGDWLVRPEMNVLERRHRGGWRGWRGNGGIAGRVDLEPKPMQLLVALAGAGGVVVTREQLRIAVWQRDYISDEVITVAVRSLRKALGDDALNPAYIQTFPGKGYRLVCEARPLGKTWHAGAAILALGAAALIMAFVLADPGAGPARIPLPEIPENAVPITGPIPELKAEDREAFLRAKYVVRRGDARLLDRAVLALDDLIARYPGEAGLLVAAANARLRSFQFSGFRRRYLDEANAFLESAVALERAKTGTPGSSAALAALAVVRYYRDWDIPGADALFQSALAADGADPLTRRRYARYLAEQQRFAEAWQILEPVKALDPEAFGASDEAMLLYFEGRFEEAITGLNEVLVLRTEPGDIHFLMALNLEALGRYDQAIEALVRHYEHSAYDSEFIEVLRRTYSQGGRQGVNAYFRDFFIGMKARGVPSSPVRIARYALGAGDRAEAIARLRQAMEARDPALLSISVDPAFRDLRGLPVFEELVAQIRAGVGG